MPRKSTKGYFVRGHFVAAGSELDQELKRELKGSAEMSKTDLKRHSERLQALGEALLTLRDDLMAQVRGQHDLPDKLIDALDEARRITNFEGRRRQMQYIGKLMRHLDPEPYKEAVALFQLGHARNSLALHESEAWRTRLIKDDQALTSWVAEFPDSDVQRLRTLIRNARKDAAAAPEARSGKGFRELFQYIKAAHEALPKAEPTGDQGEDDEDA